MQNLLKFVLPYLLVPMGQLAGGGRQGHGASIPTTVTQHRSGPQAPASWTCRSASRGRSGGPAAAAALDS